MSGWALPKRRSACGVSRPVATRPVWCYSSKELMLKAVMDGRMHELVDDASKEEGGARS